MVALKLVYADDIRKIHTDCLSISTLYEKIRSLFSELESIPFDRLYLYYVDDENDKIRIKFDNELCEALRYTSEKNILLKIFIQKQGPAAKSEVPDNVNLDPLLGWMAPMLLNNPSTMQQMASMLPAMLPLINSMLGISAPLNTSQVKPTTSSSTSPPTTSYVDGWNDSVPRSDSSVGTEYNCASVSTNTLVDAKDVATETFKGVAQTTQTLQRSPSHQMTQTIQNSTSGTQTALGVLATQTTQTSQKESCATQTAHNAQLQQNGATQTHQNGETQTARQVQAQQHGATQTAQTLQNGTTQTAQAQQNGAATQTVQVQQNGATQTIQARQSGETQTIQAQQNGATQTAQSNTVMSTQTQSETPTATGETQTPGDSFYASLAQTKFGGLLEQLSVLGFTDKEKCVQALVKNGGKLHEAIDELLLDSLLA